MKRIHVVVSMAMACAGMLAVAAMPAVVPAPQTMKVSRGTFVSKAKTVDRSLYAFRSDATLPIKVSLLRKCSPFNPKFSVG